MREDKWEGVTQREKTSGYSMKSGKYRENMGVESIDNRLEKYGVRGEGITEKPLLEGHHYYRENKLNKLSRRSVCSSNKGLTEKYS